MIARPSGANSPFVRRIASAGRTLALAAGVTTLVSFVLGNGTAAASTAADGAVAPLPLPPGAVVVGPVYRRDGSFVASIATGADANAYAYGTPPTLSFVDDAPAAAVRTTEATQYVRFYTDGVTRPVGGFVAGSNVVRGLTPAQVKDALALPFLPDSYTLVTVPSGTCILVAQGASILGTFPANPPAIPAPGPWGRGGVAQALLIGTSGSANCADPQYLPAENYRNPQPMGGFALAYVPRAGAGNPGAVARALDHATFPTPFTDIDGVYDRLDLLNVGDPRPLRAALSQLGGEGYANLGTLPVVAGRSLLRVVADRARAAGARGGLFSGSSDRSHSDGVWLDGFGGPGHLGGNDDGYGVDFDVGGVALGVDIRASAEWTAGAVVSFSRGTLSTVGLADSGHSELGALVFDATFDPGTWRVHGAAGYGRSSARMDRAIAFPGQQRRAASESAGDVFLAALEFDAPLALGPSDVLTPAIGVQAVVAGAMAFDETGAGAIDLKGRVDRTRSVRSLAGAQWNHRRSEDGTVFDLSGRLAWTHELADVLRRSDATLRGLADASFTVRSAAAPRDAAVLGLGLAAASGRGSGFLRYEGTVANGAATHTFAAGLGLRF